MPMGLGHRPPRAKKIMREEASDFGLPLRGGGDVPWCVVGRWLLTFFSHTLASQIRVKIKNVRYDTTSIDELMIRVLFDVFISFRVTNGCTQKYGDLLIEKLRIVWYF